MDEKSTQLAEALLRAFAKFSKNEKKPRHYGVDQLLHPSEIHMVMRVGNNPGAHVSELARIAGITRGAVSQLIARLVKKGLIQKVEDPESSLKTVPVLTNKGKVAFYATNSATRKAEDKSPITSVTSTMRNFMRYSISCI